MNKRTKTATFAFDTENLVMLDGQVIAQDEMKERLKDVKCASACPAKYGRGKSMTSITASL